MDKKTHPKNEKNKQNKTEKYRGFKKITQSEREMHKKKKMDGWDSAEGSVLIHQTSNVCKLPRAWQCAIDTKNLHPCWKTILQNLFGSSGETIKQFKRKKKKRSEVVEIKRQPREPSRVPESDPVPEGEGGGWYHQQDASIKTSDTRGKL